MSPAGSPSLLAAESREPVLQFALAKSLPYGPRMALVVALAAGGLALQVALLSVLPGLPLLAAALLLAWVRGFDNRLDRRSFLPDASWEGVPFERIGEIGRLDRSMRGWDRSGTDISSGRGFGLWVLAGAAVAAASLLLGALAGPAAGWILAVDGVVLVLLQWFSGMRSIDRRADLVLKAEHLVEVAALARDRIAEAGELRGQLRVEGGEEASAPVDARCAVAFRDAPAWFLGVQVQVVLNRVQGRPFPYCYAVVVAKEGHGLLSFAGGREAPPTLLVEAKAEEGVEIAVVRQRTDATVRTAGYHTDAGASADIVAFALDLARDWLAGKGPGAAG